MNKKIVAVIFGGRSVEHDVSILTGLQFLDALDSNRFTGLPIYIDPLGQWWTGSALKKRSLYPVENGQSADLTAVNLDLNAVNMAQPQLLSRSKKLLGEKIDTIPFDIMVPAIHGSNGEDGTLQGLLEFARIPYTGCRLLGAAVTMDKAFTKQTARAADINVLDDLLIDRPIEGVFLDEKNVAKMLKEAMPNSSFPYIVKPVNLGSSVGVSRAGDMDEMIAALLAVFRLDNQAIIEPFVDNLSEYNIAVRMGEDGKAETSAIEQPEREADLLDFKGKYLAGSKAGSPKLDAPSEGMVSLNRVINPDGMTVAQETFIRTTAAKIFDMLALAGSVRIDFLCDSKSGEVWFNEVNTIPGSFAYFLWQDAPNPMSFVELTSHMIDEGFRLSKARLGSTGAAAGGATIFQAG